MTTQTLLIKPSESDFVYFSINDAIQQVDSLLLKVVTAQEYTDQAANACLEAVKYHFAAPGQKVRAKLCLHACMKLGVNMGDMLILAAVSELLHNASLIHDDIQDNDETRRGCASVWKKFGVDIAICAGDLLLSTAYGVLANYSKPKLLPKLITTINAQTRAAIEGQSSDISYKNNQKISLEKYAQIAAKKSGALLSLPIEMALIASENVEWLETTKKACANFAVGYQIIDDIEDIVKDAGNKNVRQSININFVLKDLGFDKPQHEASLLCQDYLNQVVNYAQQLPKGSGQFLLRLVETLKNKLHSASTT